MTEIEVSNNDCAKDCIQRFGSCFCSSEYDRVANILTSCDEYYMTCSKEELDRAVDDYLNNQYD
jgi:hypothetical protein